MTDTQQQTSWPIWRKITFRFFFIYFSLSVSQTMIYYLLGGISFLYFIPIAYYNVNSAIVTFFNKYLWNIKEQLVPKGGSGDSSFGWAELCTYLFLALIGCVIWSIFDRKRKHYKLLNPWLNNLIRYYIAAVGFRYGIIKLFALQMPFSNLHQLATPLGDFLPMRLSWMFMGYSTQYQIFTGVMETLVGILLLYRKTATTGVLLGLGVFMNVVLLNLCFDIPVKIFSMQVLVACVYLSLVDWKRIANFFFLNKPTESCDIYHINLTENWQKIGRIIFKVFFVFMIVIMTFYYSITRYQSYHGRKATAPFKESVYNIQTFVKNNDTIPLLVNDTLQWKDFIFDKSGSGSVNSKDTLFRQRYGRGYFFYEADTIAQTIDVKRYPSDTTNLFTFEYEMPKPDHFKLWTVVRGDSIYMELAKSKRHFQLAERQFHWLSEANR